MVKMLTDDFTAGTESVSQNAQEVMIEGHVGDPKESWQLLGVTRHGACFDCALYRSPPSFCL